MAMNYIQIVTLREPLFATDPRFAAFALYAQEELDPNYFGEDYQKAVALKIMDLMTLDSKKALGAGKVTSITEGGISVSYADDSSSSSSGSHTIYGKELEELTRNCSLGILNLSMFKD